MKTPTFDVTPVRCRYLASDGTASDRPAFDAILRTDGHDARLVEMSDVPTLPRDVIRAYASSGWLAGDEVASLVDSNHPVSVSGKPYPHLPEDVLDGVHRHDLLDGQAEKSDDPIHVDVVEVVALDARGHETVSHGLRVRGPSFDSFGAYPLAEIVGMETAQAVDKARCMSDEASHTVRTSELANGEVFLNGVAVPWRDDVMDPARFP